MIILVLLLLAFVVYSVIGKIYAKFWQNRLNIEIFLPEDDVFEGETADIKEIVVNDKYLPLPTLEIDFSLDKSLHFSNSENSSISDKLYRRDIFYAGMKKKITRTLPVQCTKRGYYTLDKLGFMSYDIFMQQKFFGKKSFFQNFYVYPARVSTEQISVVYNQIMGEVLSRQKIYDDPFSFAGIRDYTITDPMKNINWKASAKNGSLLVNICDSAISQKLTIIIDCFENASVAGNQLSEESIRIASSLSEIFIAQGVSISVLGNSHDLFTKESLELRDLQNLSVNEIRKNFSRLTFSKEEEIDSCLEQASDDELLVIISKNPETAEKIKSLANDIVWVMPYKYDQPKVADTKAKMIYWLFQSNNL
ncbi:MAG: DUF58 domain-containing protein [Clostridia bacterium]